MSTRQRIVMLLAALLLGPLGALHAAAERPNVVVNRADDMAGRIRIATAIRM